MDSTWTSHLRTNYVPSKSEIEQIQKHISRPLEDCARLEEKIARFQLLLDDFQAQHEKLDAYIQNHLALVSGARRLPHDVVQEIFRRCLPIDRNAVMSAAEPPLLLGRICSSWRKIVLSTPDIWATLHVAVPSFQALTDYDLWIHVTAAVKTWLELSGDLPLSISVACPPFLGQRADRQTSLTVTYLLNLLVRYSRRWERIDFTFPLPELVTAVALLTKADVPLLKSVILESTVLNDFTLADQWPPLISFLNTPTLSEVSIVSFKYTTFLQPLPWTQLTGLHLDSNLGPWDHSSALSEIDALNILKQCSMLVTCKLFIESDPASPLPQPATHEITLPFLRSFILVEGTQNTLTRMFIDCLKFPALNYLGFYRFSNSRIGHLPFGLTGFFTRENKIEELELGLEGIQLQSLADCLLRAKYIKRLTLNGPERLWGYPPNSVTGLNNHILYLLIPTPDEELRCPLLEEITLRSCREISDAKILLFLEERTDPTNGMTILKRATFTVNREIVTDIMPDVQPLIAAGLELDLKYIPPVLDLDSEGIENPNGPKLRVSYVSCVPDQKFSPFRGLRAGGVVGSFNRRGASGGWVH